MKYFSILYNISCLQKLLGDVERVAWVGLVSQFRLGSWQLHQTEEAAIYFNFNSSLALDKGGQCALMGGGDQGWAVASCARHGCIFFYRVFWGKLREG